MVRMLVMLVSYAAVVCLARSAKAGEFDIVARIQAGDRATQTQETRQTPVTKDAAARPVADVARDQPIRLSWQARNASNTEEFKDVLVHFFVVRQKETGQTEVPPLGRDVSFEGAVTMDFKPQDSTDWKSTFKIHEPGSYLFRVETIGMLDKSGHEYYAAMDIVVK